MKASLRALLSGVIDYAGLFPPAKLPLEEAIRNYARYRTEPESWMLGRFICPAARLADLPPLLEQSLLLEQSFPDKPYPRISVLGRGGKAPHDFLDAVRSDSVDIAGFLSGAVAAYEVRLPEGLGDAGSVAELVSASARVLCESALTLGNIHWEISLSVRWRDVIRNATGGIAAAWSRLSASTHLHHVGLKLRCGGLDASAFPTVEQVAFTMTASRDAAVPLKFTAGLHHPIRRFDASVQTHMHGFLNVFVAGVLAHARGLDEEQIRFIIEDENPASFRFDDDGLSWKDYRATVSEIEAARRQAVISFGSCSFDEPRDDLRALGLLP